MKRKKPSAKKTKNKKATKKTTVKKAATQKKPALKKTSHSKAPAESPTLLAVGQAAPDFTLQSDQGGMVSLSQLRGKKVVLYFYPKDDTPGCTVEACDFRDLNPELSAQGAIVLGVSRDPIASHIKFRNKFGLQFPLLSDVDGRVCEAYGVWKEKSMYGKHYMGIERTTFVIDKGGKISRIFPKVKVDAHANEVLEALAQS